MDEIVRQALAKWPAVPHCYDWLALDARGHWRMRDAHAQHLNLPGERIAQAALTGFIARNYECDERGCWFFQNGPQRVYVLLEATPYIARSDPAQGFVLHTGAPFGAPEAAYLCRTGELILQRGAVVAQLDDRDLAQVLGRAAGDDALLAWLEGGAGALTLARQDGGVPLLPMEYGARCQRFGFVARPAPP